MENIVVEFFDTILGRSRRVEGTQIYPPTAPHPDITNSGIWILLLIILCIPVVIAFLGFVCYKGVTKGINYFEEGEYFEAIGHFALPAIIIALLLCSTITQLSSNTSVNVQASNNHSEQYEQIKDRARVYMDISNNFPINATEARRVNCEYVDACEEDSLGRADDTSYVVIDLQSSWEEGAAVSDYYTSTPIEPGNSVGVYNCPSGLEIPSDETVSLVCKDRAVVYQDGDYILHEGLNSFPEDICLTVFLYVSSNNPIYGTDTPKKDICIDIETP